MSLPAQMLDSHPAAAFPTANEAIAECIQACVECAQACIACADACLAETMVADLVRCITTDLNCADICESTGRVLTRQAGADQAMIFRMLQSCAAACKACGDECETHSQSTRTADSAPRPVDAANRRAGICWRHCQSVDGRSSARLADDPTGAAGRAQCGGAESGGGGHRRGGVNPSLAGRRHRVG